MAPHCFSMIWLAGGVLLLLTVSTEATVGSSSESFCSETKECLLFDPVCEGQGYEVRHHGPAKWVTVEEKSFIRDMATTRAFWKLFSYIRGANEEGLKIDMTAPVIIKIKERKGFWSSTVYSMSFLLPSAHQETPPKPTDDSVFITEMPDMYVYVTSYGGWIMSWTSSYHANKLRAALNIAKATYISDSYYDVGYNSPMTLLNRHNEVWYVVDGKPVCPISE